MSSSMRVPGSAVAGLFLVALLFRPAQGGFTSAIKLDLAIREANKNAKACKNKQVCYGKAVTLQLTSDIQVTRKLPTLDYSAHLIVTGNCKDKDEKRCIIDGSRRFTLFLFQSQGPQQFPKVELRNLILQNFKYGVLTGSLYATTSSTNVIFRNNIEGVVRGGFVYGGFPLQTFDSCRFVDNTGTAIAFGNAKYGFALDRTALYVKNSVFRGNKAGNIAGYGGAASLQGGGQAIFENCKFLKNYADQAGAAVYADETTIIFKGCKFDQNLAKSGPGGAVAGQSGFFQPLTASFCSCSFVNNLAAKNVSTSDLFFEVPYPDGAVKPQNATVNFCDTKVPKNSVLPQAPYGTVNVGSGGRCSSKYCGTTY